MTENMSAEPPGEKLIELLYWMMLTRGVDDRCEALFKQGRFPGSVFSQDGHEAISVGSSILLEEGDAIAPLHRSTARARATSSCGCRRVARPASTSAWSRSPPSRASCQARSLAAPA